MDAMETIYGRRAVRDYLESAPSPEELSALIESAIQAPSGMNRQPWSFVVVTGREALAQCSAKAKAYLARTLGDQRLVGHLAEMLASPAFNIFYNAPALVVICATDPDPMSLKDCCLAAQNLMLAAQATGLGSCWIGFSEAWLASPEGRAELNIPPELIPVAPIIIGRPAQAPAHPGRKPAEVRFVTPAAVS